jgi:hypothetical protein
MSFILRRPFAITATLKQSPKQPSSIVFRAFHNTPRSHNPNFFAPKTTPSLSKSQHTFRATFRRNYNSQAPAAGFGGADLRQRLIYGAAIFGGTLVGINLIFNRETREDGGMPTFEREYLNQTFMHTGLGLGIITIAAKTLHTNGWSFRLMAANPWLVLGAGLVGSIGTMYGTMATRPEK